MSAPAPVVFAGPSLAGVAAPLGIALRPPAEAGDLYRAARGGARVIGLVDGAFEDRPTVWHKEILWALDQGVRVFGAASIGALRAAECAAFGMEGVGEIFARCRDGLLEDDHELALAYAPAELGYAALSEPLVNVRATLAAAEAAGVLDAASAAALVSTAEATPFKALTWTALLAAAPPEARAALGDWLPAGRVDLKRQDALALLDAVAAAAADGMADAPPPDFAFADTRYWRAAAGWFGRQGAPVPAEDGAVLDELRLDPARFERAMVRAYARAAAAEASVEAEPAAAELVEDLRFRLGLETAADFRAWLGTVRAEADEIAAALVAEERLALALEAEAGALAGPMLAALRVDGRFEALDARAADKRRRLGVEAPPYREAELPALIAALCARRRVSIDSDDADLVARSLGLADRRALHRLLAREADYLEAIGDPG